MDYAWMPLQRYAEFSGRSRRKEYWLFHLAIIVVFVAVVILFGGSGVLFDPYSVGSSVTGVVVVIAALALVIPSLAVQVRRFHDQNRSGWFVLIGFIPYVGSLIVFIFILLPGTPGDNRFGPNPRENVDDVFA
ncbi:DUF805 domain-containing protein [Sphingomonas sp. AX6]|uniref:DUF805 domain-containing protein n=1 Tax=Sphingomonas sp. AX6 TaxID=2653171 RepID=UPI0012F00177|nr:DUF805 domain-containing protein [Sphingomonas sp. AX6]VXC91118.1 putative Inner membrane protein YhaH [Sphingomonas sp. AX6]